MKKIIILFVLVAVVCIAIFVIRNKDNRNFMNEAPKGKIAVKKSIEVKNGDIVFVAPNNLDKPALVVAKNANKVIWQNELQIPEINPNLEKDVQIVEYFVTEMKIISSLPQNTVQLAVTIGTGIRATTYILNIGTGVVEDIQIVSPPPVK